MFDFSIRVTQIGRAIKETELNKLLVDSVINKFMKLEASHK
jgi:hypothetical protein